MSLKKKKVLWFYKKFNNALVWFWHRTRLSDLNERIYQTKLNFNCLKHFWKNNEPKLTQLLKDDLSLLT